MGRIGTKSDFGTWLSTEKHMTYTKYATLVPEVKRKIQEEYKKGKHHGSGQSNLPQEGTQETVS